MLLGERVEERPEWKEGDDLRGPYQVQGRMMVSLSLYGTWDTFIHAMDMKSRQQSTGYILEVKMIVLADELDVGHERKRGLKDFSKVSVLDRWDTNYCCGEEPEEQIVGEKCN